VPVYSYTALDTATQLQKGTLTAETPADGRQRLRERGLRIVSFGLASPRRFLSFQWGPRQRQREQVAEVARYLALLLRAGVPLAEALEVTTRNRPGALTTVLHQVRERISSGGTLADALGEHPRWFDRLFISAVQVGEIAGSLEEAFTELANHLQAGERLRSQLVGALAYPLIVLMLGIGVMVFLMTFVMPQLLEVLTTTGRPLPAATVLLKNFSDFLIHRWWAVLLVVGIGTAGVTLALRHPAGRRGFERLLLRLPVLGALLQKSIVAGFAQQMSLLLRTGVPFVEAVRNVAPLTRSQVLRDELATVGNAVEAGSDIAPAMADTRIFPPVVVHLVAIGQDSGELTEMLSTLNERYESEVQLALSRFTTVLEPLLIVLLAAGVGFVVFACLMPILEATRGMAA
jgi:type II secretory pathway component PulF